MEYRIINTTDLKYIGKHIIVNNLNIGNNLILDDFVFKIERIYKNEKEITLFSYNYIVVMIEV